MANNNNNIPLTKDEFKALVEMGKYNEKTDTITLPKLKSNITTRIAFMCDYDFNITTIECKYLQGKELTAKEQESFDKKLAEGELVLLEVDGCRAIGGNRASKNFVAWFDKEGNKNCWIANNQKAKFASVGTQRIIENVIFE